MEQAVNLAKAADRHLEDGDQQDGQRKEKYAWEK